MKQPEHRYFINFNSQSPDNQPFDGNVNSPLPHKRDINHLPILQWSTECRHHHDADWNRDLRVFFGKHNVLQPLYFRFYVCRHSVMLARHMFEGTPFKHVTIRAFQQDNTPYLNLLMSHVFVIHAEIDALSGGHPLTVFGLSYSKVEWVYSADDSDGRGKVVAAGYDENDQYSRLVPDQQHAGTGRSPYALETFNTAGAASAVRTTNATESAATEGATESPNSSDEITMKQFQVHAKHLGEPLADQPYEIESYGKSIFGQTDANGKIDVEIPESWQKVTLTVGDTHHWELAPNDYRDGGSGVLQQLQNLGFNAKTAGIAPKDAIKEFQKKHGLSPDGEIGPKTKDVLERESDR